MINDQTVLPCTPSRHLQHEMVACLQNALSECKSGAHIILGSQLCLHFRADIFLRHSRKMICVGRAWQYFSHRINHHHEDTNTRRAWAGLKPVFLQSLELLRNKLGRLCELPCEDMLVLLAPLILCPTREKAIPHTKHSLDEP